MYSVYTHSNGTNASSTKTSEAELFLSVKAEQYDQVAGSIEHHVLGQYCKVGALLTLIAK